ncbi:MFS transporter [Streptomyces anulatus]|uniref:MFS transporter n=1 Tax=Streptomyces TaxID=1883 RepID=UPI0009599B61|nr:MFS transporter [Streptomyces sp. TSRI0395]OKI75963.1 MFS transporter [Streptomyces sp. TSRI0395]
MDTETAPRAGVREWIGLAALALPAMLVIMDMSVLHLALPTLSRDLEPSGAELLWITDVYGFVIAGAMITMGTLGDRIGRRRMLMTGAVAFGLASVLAAYAPTAETLIVARALLGLAGAVLGPSTLSLISAMFHDAEQRSFAITVWMTSFMLGGAVGPLVGGVLLEAFWWGSVFLVAVPVMVFLLVAGPLVLPEVRNPDAGRLDLTSAAMSLAAILLVVLGVKEFAEEGATWLPLLSLVTGLVIGALFVLRQRRLTDPLLDMKLFANRGFSVSLGTLTLTVVFMLGSQFLISQYIQMVVGMEPLESAVWSLPMVVSGTLAMFVAQGVAARVGKGYVFGAGLTIAAVGFTVLSQVDSGSGIGTVVTAASLLFAGLMPVSSLGIGMIVDAAPPEQAGSAAAVGETTQELGGALGIAVLGSVLNVAYHGGMTGSVPDGVPASAREAVADNLPAALETAGRLPVETGAQLVSAARDSFTQGLASIAMGSVPVMLALAVTATMLLRNVGRAGEGADREGAAGETGEDGKSTSTKGAATP